MSRLHIYIYTTPILINITNRMVYFAMHCFYLVHFLCILCFRGRPMCLWVLSQVPGTHAHLGAYPWALISRPDKFLDVWVQVKCSGMRSQMCTWGGPCMYIIRFLVCVVQWMTMYCKVFFVIKCIDLIGKRLFLSS